MDETLSGVSKKGFVDPDPYFKVDSHTLWAWVDHNGSPVRSEDDIIMHFKQLANEINNLSDDHVNIQQILKNASQEGFYKSDIHIFSDDFVAFLSEKLISEKIKYADQPTQFHLAVGSLDDIDGIGCMDGILSQAHFKIPQTDQELQKLGESVSSLIKYESALSEPNQFIQATAEEFLTQHSPRKLINSEFWDSLFIFHSPNQMHKLISEAPLDVVEQAAAFVNHQGISPHLIDFLSNQANIEKSPLATVNAYGNILTPAEVTEYSSSLTRELEALELPPEYLQRAKEYLSNPEAYRTPELSSTKHIYSDAFESFITKKVEAHLDTDKAKFMHSQDSYQRAVQNMVDNTLTASPETIERGVEFIVDIHMAGDEFLSGGDKTIKNLINERYWPDFLAYIKSQKLTGSLLSGKAFNLVTGARTFVNHKGVNPRFRYLVNHFPSKLDDHISQLASLKHPRLRYLMGHPLSGHMSPDALADLMRSGSTKQVNRVSKSGYTKLPTLVGGCWQWEWKCNFRMSNPAFTKLSILPERIAKFAARVPVVVPIIGSLTATGLGFYAMFNLLNDTEENKTGEGRGSLDVPSSNRDPEHHLVHVPNVGSFKALPFSKSHPTAITKILDHLGSIITEQPNEQNISKGELLKCLPSPSNEPECTPI